MKKTIKVNDELALIIRKVLLEDEFYVGSPLGVSLSMSSAIQKYINSKINKLKRTCKPECDRCESYNMALGDIKYEFRTRKRK